MYTSISLVSISCNCLPQGLGGQFHNLSDFYSYIFVNTYIRIYIIDTKEMVRFPSRMVRFPSGRCVSRPRWCASHPDGAFPVQMVRFPS